MSASQIQRYPRKVRAFYVAVSLPIVVGLAINAILHPDDIFQGSLLFWTVAVAAAELMPVPTRQGGLELSLGFPILLAVLMIYDPLPAASIALVGAFDRRELRRRVQLSTGLFNRSQIALSVLAGSAVFHGLVRGAQPWPILIAGVIAARVADYLVNVTMVTAVIRLTTGAKLRQAVGMLRVGTPTEFLLNYLGLSLIGLVIYELYRPDNYWAVAAFVAPLVFARQMFLRTMALEDATKELKDRERVLRALSNRMAEERQDERLRIAGYLHDDVAQALFQLTLRLEMAKKRLLQGDADAAGRDLDQIADIKARTSSMIRSLVRDLHAAPIGRTGLADAIGSLATEFSRERTEIVADVPHVDLPPPIQLLIYQIAREAVMNSMKHAEPAHIWVTLLGTGDGVDLTVRDDGAGFDTSLGPPEGHFGTIMMRERALVAGGSFKIDSQPGGGTTVTAHFPQVWIQDAVEAGPAGGEAGTTGPTRGSEPGPDLGTAEPLRAPPDAQNGHPPSEGSPERATSPEQPQEPERRHAG